MAQQGTHALSDVLDQLEKSAQGDSISVDEVVKTLGQRSFASLMLIFSLVSTSPASGIPGLTTMVGVIVLLLVVQLIFGRKCVWLPGFITKRHMGTDKVRKGIGWLRKPVHLVERLIKPRLTWLFHRPILLVPLILVALLTLFMPFMEIIPTSGSIASAVIALFAASLLTRDGALMILALIVLLGVPVAVWYFGFSG
ncbi:exopolysaccharide biosynthesis protein [Devosia sp. RR2S18]|uniref:exopolysaccharide biosynthesis protein n=1 Tax=Devosia rhizosphaerae TaxID=3049774 RepID=UPI0025423758|nr:exopolysaccharide biosynthesis protein [Devosia sp. RR2S18]WIJ23764.1 exopolysaccharide biosynthesis protein [Devosia sp. RR2S18]